MLYSFRTFKSKFYVTFCYLKHIRFLLTTNKIEILIEKSIERKFLFSVDFYGHCQMSSTFNINFNI